jgi:catechol 2,3-dioxygenase-like lactoylglutathione lyase family enzyme
VKIAMLMFATVALILAVAPLASAQLTAAQDGPIVYGHHHLNVTDIAAHKKFWVDTLGGTAVPFGGGELFKFPNVLVFVTEREPTGGTKGTTVNHIGFTVPSTRAMVAKLRAAGYPIVTQAELPPALAVEDDMAYIADQDTYIAFVLAPDDVKVEILEARGQRESIALHHVHFGGPVDEMKAWYVETFGAAPGVRGSFQAADLPGVNLTYSPSPDPVVGTRGRSLDHIGFEVDGLEAFCRKLEAAGVEFQSPYRKIDELGIGVAFFTDPFGTYIELTEGLDQF